MASTSPGLSDALREAETSARRHRPALRRALRHLRVTYAARSGPTEVTCVLFSGQRMRVVLPEIVGTQLYRDGFIEAPLSRVIIERLRPGMVFFDVGAQYGYHSLIAAALVAPGGTVVAFEPARHAFLLLSHNVGSVEAIVPENVAVSDRSGTIALHDFGALHSALNTTLPAARVPPEERRRLRADDYSVASTTIDDYVGMTGLVPDFVKLDAEGAELAILRGMRGVLRDTAPVLAMEAGDYVGMSSPETAASIRFLDDLGYRCLEYRGALRPHQRRLRYGYDNLFFVKG